jgi:hypothetical protein
VSFGSIGIDVDACRMAVSRSIVQPKRARKAEGVFRALTLDSRRPIFQGPLLR